jgi:hypothetical protein
MPIFLVDLDDLERGTGSITLTTVVSIPFQRGVPAHRGQEPHDIPSPLQGSSNDPNDLWSFSSVFYPSSLPFMPLSSGDERKFHQRENFRR